MSALPTIDPATGGKLVSNIMHFARALRLTGLPVGPGKLLEAVRAVEVVGPRRRDDFYWALHAVLVERHEQHEIFEQAFRLFWRDPRLLQGAAPLVRSGTERRRPKQLDPVRQRVLDALMAGAKDEELEQPEPEVELDRALSYSPEEVFRHKDFESMSAAELAAARQAIARMRLPIVRLPTRRFVADPQGQRVDMRATLRAGLRTSGLIMPLRRKTRTTRPPPLVILCDVSGSMSRYSRLFVHFVHAVTSDRERVSTFLFGTQLSNVTRHLRHKDVDIALDRIGAAVEDWSGGTRIGVCLKEFNLHWSRRVLGQGALVLLITDGLDRDDVGVLAVEIERLHKSCRRLIWLNPLLRYEGFRAEAAGVKAILPHVDDFRPVHNLDSLADLTEALSRASDRAGGTLRSRAA